LKKTPELVTDTQTYNSWVREQWIQMWVENSGRTYQDVEERFQEKDVDLNTIAHEGREEPCLVLGSGPSLEDAIPYLKNWKHSIQCSTSQLAVLQKLGVEPTYCWLIDADPQMTYLVENYDSKNSKTILLTHVNIQREALRAWKGEVRFFKMYDPGDIFFTKYLQMMYQKVNREKDWGVRTFIMNAGCVVNTMMVTAPLLGFAPIFLCGFDLGFPGGQYRFREPKLDGGWEDPVPIPEGRLLRVAHNGVKTDDVSIFYKYGFLTLHGMTGPKWVVSCSRGILDEIPCAPAAEVIERQGQGYEWAKRTDKEAYKVSQAYLKKRGIYLLRTGRYQSVTSPQYHNLWNKIRFWISWLRYRNDLNWEENAKKAGIKYGKMLKRWEDRIIRRGKRFGYGKKPEEEQGLRLAWRQMGEAPRERFKKAMDQMRLGYKHRKMAKQEKQSAKIQVT